MANLQMWTAEDEKTDQNEEEKSELPRTNSQTVLPFHSFWTEETEDGLISPTDQRTINELPRDDGWVDVDIVKGHNGLWMRQKEIWADDFADTGEETAAALSLVPKRRRRIGTTDGKQWKKSATWKNEKMAKSKVPKAFPRNDGIGLKVQSDFVEKSVGEEEMPTTREGTVGQKQMKKEGKEKKKQRKETEKERKGEKTEKEEGKEEKMRREEKEEKWSKQKEEKEKEEKEGPVEGDKSISSKNSTNQQTASAGRDFWANALRTLLIEFRKMHPELIGGGKAKRRTTEQSKMKSNGTSAEEEAEDKATIANSRGSQSRAEKATEGRGPRQSPGGPISSDRKTQFPID